MDSAQGTRYFPAVEGIGAPTEATDYEQGGNQKFMHKLLGANKWVPVTLRKGSTPTLSSSMDVQRRPRQLTITQLATRPSEAARSGGQWSLIVTPSRRMGLPKLDSGNSGISIETLTPSPRVHLAICSRRRSPSLPRSPAAGQGSDRATVTFATNSSSVASPTPSLQTAEELRSDPALARSTSRGTRTTSATPAPTRPSPEQRANSGRTTSSTGAPSPTSHATGYGESQPIADNNTSAGRSQNRRTTVKDS